jgi:hypothetical protein
VSGARLGGGSLLHLICPLGLLLLGAVGPPGALDPPAGLEGLRSSWSLIAGPWLLPLLLRTAAAEGDRLLVVPWLCAMAVRWMMLLLAMGPCGPAASADSVAARVFCSW